MDFEQIQQFLDENDVDVISEYLESTIILNNTLTQWLTALLIILVAVLLNRILDAIFTHWLKRLARQTETQMDDIVIDMIEEPVEILVIVVGVRLSLDTLNILASIAVWVEVAFQITVALIIAWFIIRLLERIYQEYKTGLNFVLLGRTFFLLLLSLAAFILAWTWILRPVTCIPNCIGLTLTNRSLANLNLRGTNLVEANLRGADFSGADLRDADLSGAILVGASFRQANLSNTKFIGADLTDADLRDVILEDTNFNGADLTRVDLTNTDMRTVQLNGTVFWNATLIGVNLNKRTDLAGGLFSFADFTGADLSNTNFSGANLSGANLSGVSFVESNLSGALINIATLTGVNFSDANLSGASFIGSNLASTTLVNADLVGANLIGADLSGADVSGADLENVLIFRSEWRPRDVIVDRVLDELSDSQKAALNCHNANFSGVRSNEETEGLIIPESTLNICDDETAAQN